MTDRQQFAIKVAQAAASNPGQERYNPLFFYGPSGVEKAQLLKAITAHISCSLSKLNVILTNGEAFTYEFIQAITHDGTLKRFREKYRGADVLLIDNIQFIAGKQAVQEEFYFTFNELYEHKKQIILTADQKPSEMRDLEDRLRCCFESGILVPFTINEDCYMTEV